MTLVTAQAEPGHLDEAELPAATPRKITSRSSAADRAFVSLLVFAGSVVLITMGIVGVFLASRGSSAIRVAGWRFLTTQAWNPTGGAFGVAAVLTGTILIGAVAILIAVPLAVGTALYISEYAPKGLRGPLINMVDLMAAIPSIAYGLWGVYLLQPKFLVVGTQGTGLPRWLATYLGWIPIFNVNIGDLRDPLLSPTTFVSSTFIAGIVVGIMVTPIATSIMRENFSQAPVGEREGALALGATKWGMIRSVVIPFARGGMIGGTMLALGRALGETIAVYMIITPIFVINFHILQKGGNSIAALIALRFQEATSFELSALMAAGLTLFTMTLIINFGASAVIARSRSGAVSDA